MILKVTFDLQKYTQNNDWLDNYRFKIQYQQIKIPLHAFLLDRPMTRNTGSKRIPNPSIMSAPSIEESRLLFKGTDHVTWKR